jgi:hypothetical protein
VAHELQVDAGYDLLQPDLNRERPVLVPEGIGAMLFFEQ